MIEDSVIAAAFGVTEADLTDAMRDLVDNALSAVERETQRYFREIREFTHHAKGGGSSVWLPEVPVVDEDSDPLYTLTVEEWDYSGSAWSEIDESSYELWTPDAPNDRAELVYMDGSCWPVYERCKRCPQKNIRVTYFAGYEVGGLPREIERLVLRWASADRVTSGTGSTASGLKKETLGDYSYEKFGNSDGAVSSLTAEDQATIDAWRRTKHVLA